MPTLSNITDLRRISLLQDLTVSYKPPTSSTTFNPIDSEITLVENYGGKLGFFNDFMGRWYALAEINSSTEFNYKALDTTLSDWLSVGNADPIKTITLTFEEFALNGIANFLSPIRRNGIEHFVNSIIYIVRGDEEFYAKCEVTSFTSNTLTITCREPFTSPLYKCEIVHRAINGTTSAMRNIPKAGLPTSLLLDAGLCYISPYETTYPQMKLSYGRIIKTDTNTQTPTLRAEFPNEYGIGDLRNGDTTTFADYFIPYVPNVGYAPRYVHKFQRMSELIEDYPIVSHTANSQTVTIAQNMATPTCVKKFIMSNDIIDDDWYQWTSSSHTSLTYNYSSQSATGKIKYGFFSTKMGRHDEIDMPYYLTNFFPILPFAGTPPTWGTSYNSETYDFNGNLNATPTNFGSFSSSGVTYQWQKLRLENFTSAQTTDLHWEDISTGSELQWTSVQKELRWEVVRCKVGLKYNGTTYYFLAFNQPWISVGFNIIKDYFQCHQPLVRNSKFCTRIGIGGTTDECTAKKVIYSCIGTRDEEEASGSTQNRFFDSYDNEELELSYISMTQTSEDSRPIMIYPRNDYSLGANHFMLNPLGDMGNLRIQNEGLFSVYPQLNPFPVDKEFRNINSGNIKLLDYEQHKTLTKYLLCPFNLYNTRALNIHEESQVGITQENFLDVVQKSGTYPERSDENVNFTFTKFVSRDELTRIENVEFRLFDVL